MKNYSKYSMIAFILLLFVISGCGAAEKTQTDDNKEQLSIYTTLYPLEFFVEEIGGAHVDVTSILPAGADAHTYEPTSKTMVDMAGADVFIYLGAQMEAYADTITAVLKEEEVDTVEVSKGVSLVEHQHEGETDEHAHEEGHDHEEETSDEAEHNHGNEDPHIWLDPTLSVELAENMKQALVELKPEAEQEFERNFEDLKASLEQLDEDFHNRLTSQERKEILVTHAAYGYWERAYGIKQIAITGISPAEEPSQKQLEDVIDTVNEHQIRYLLFEQNVKPKVASVIQDETGVESLQLHNLSTLTEEDIEAEEDYFSLMYQNLDVLTTALEN